MRDPRTQMVADGYDVIGETFADRRRRIVGDPRREWEDELVARLDEGARVLELGCGGGTPETTRLARRFQSDLPGRTGEWLGAPTFFSGFPADVNSRLVREAGFTIERDEVVAFEEPEGEAKFQWVLARA